jgi:hypothetical protein
VPLEPQTTNGGSDRDARMQSVAVATLFTVSSRTPDGIGPSIDGAFVLRHSIVRTLPDHHSVATELRRTGLESFSPHSAHPVDGVRTENVDVYKFHVPDGASGLVDIELRFVALVTPDVPQQFLSVIRGVGYEVWMTHSPVNASEIRNEQIRNETLVDGAMGIAELTKLDGLRMGREFDTVIMVDCDVMFHKLFTIDNPRDRVDRQSSTAMPQPSLWAPGGGGLLNIGAVLGWTKGGWASERINGGFLVFSPRHPLAAVHLQRIVELLREGDFRPGTGWKGRGIGWTYGGRTIQGVLPHYFFLEASDAASDSAANLSAREPSSSAVRPHLQLDRCRYNNMVQLEPCKVVPFATVTSNHFTGDCVKPWTCSRRPHPLCGAFVDAWLDTYRLALLKDRRVRRAVETSGDLSLFAMAKWEPSHGACPGRGHFVSLAAELLRRSKH